jgi:hypothetical protein
MYTDDTITLELTENEVATLFYAINREKARQVENFSHEKRGRERIAEIEDMMDSIRDQAMEQEMRDPRDNL